MAVKPKSREYCTLKQVEHVGKHFAASTFSIIVPEHSLILLLFNYTVSTRRLQEKCLLKELKG